MTHVVIETDESDAAADHGAAKIAGSHGALGRGKEGFSPGAYRGSTGLPAPGSQASSRQNRETVNFCCFQPPGVW